MASRRRAEGNTDLRVRLHRTTGKEETTMSETADGRFLREVADSIAKYVDIPSPETVAKLRELADRCDIVAYPSLTLEAKLWVEIEREVELLAATGRAQWAEPGFNLVSAYLVAVQLKKLADRQLAAGGLAGMGATMAALVMNKAGEKKPDKKRHR